MGEQHSSAAEHLLLSFAGVAAVYTDALADYTHRLSESTRNFVVQSASAATPVEASEALVSYLVQQYSETIAFTGKLLNSEPLENDLPIEPGGATPVQRFKVARKHADNFVLFGKPHDTCPMPYVTYVTKNAGASQGLSSQRRFSRLLVLANKSGDLR